MGITYLCELAHNPWIQYVIGAGGSNSSGIVNKGPGSLYTV